MSATVEGRSLEAQLATARFLLAQFIAQIDEYEAMGSKRRIRTMRGRELSRRIYGLREGKAKWEARAADLEARIVADTPADG